MTLFETINYWGKDGSVRLVCICSFLFVPKYPESAKATRADGFDIVEVDIDEQGSVTKTKATCGFLDLVEAVEGAELKSNLIIKTIRARAEMCCSDFSDAN